VETPQPPAPLCFVLMRFGRKTDAAGRVTNFDFDAQIHRP
jgi:hypothetical protein